MGNCLDVPEPKGRRRAASLRNGYRNGPPRRSVVMAAHPKFVHAFPEGYYPPHSQEPSYYPYAPELPPGAMFMVDPTTGQEYLMAPVFEPQPHFYTGQPEVGVYYPNTPMPNGVEHNDDRQHHHHHHHHRQHQHQRQQQDADEDEVDNDEAKVIRRKSREDRKLSQGQKDNDKVDITDITSFSAYSASGKSGNHVVTEAVSHTSPLTTRDTIVTSSVDTVIMSSAADVHVVTSSIEMTSNGDVNTELVEGEIEVSSPDVDWTDHSIQRPMVVSFSDSLSHVIPENKTDIISDNDCVFEGKDEIRTVVTSRGVQPKIFFRRPSTSVDVVITYSILARMESDIVRRLSSLLEASDISVWAERLGDSSRARKSDTTAKTILNAKVVVVILSEGSCHQRFVRDHVALATVTDSPIFPVTTQPPREVLEAMPVELRLQLPNDPEEWTELGSSTEDRFLFVLRSLARLIQESVEYCREKEKNGQVRRVYSANERRRSSVHQMKAATFWDVHFGHRFSVKWERFRTTIEDEYCEHLTTLYDMTTKPALFEGMRRRLCEPNSDSVTRDHFITMCTGDNGDIDVWESILRIGRMEQAVRDIFDAESTVRHLVLENTEILGRHAIVETLCPLLSDVDANVRAVSVVSLSRCLSTDDADALAVVMPTLNDEDRLVREAGCLALGNLKTQLAVTKLIHVWRNDVISGVRDAAFLALNKIGGPEVEEAMRVMDVLSEEIRDLTLDVTD